MPDPTDLQPAPDHDAVDLAGTPDFTIGGCTVRPSHLMLVHSGGSIRLEPKVMQVLLVLWRGRGRIVTRDDLRQQCWGGLIVSDDAVTRCIMLLRSALRSAAMEGIEVVTLPRLGYKLRVQDAPPAPALGPPGAAAEPPAPGDAQPEPVEPPGRYRSTVPRAAAWVLATVAVAAIVGGSMALIRGGAPDRGRGGSLELVGMSLVGSPDRLEMMPALSPDGLLTAFSGTTDLGMPSDISIAPGTRSSAQPFAATDMTELWPQWSPQGAKLAYMRQQPNSTCELVVHTYPEGVPEVVHDCRRSGPGPIGWSADGRSIYFSDSVEAMKPTGIWRLDLGTGNTIPVVETQHDRDGARLPAASPDGRYLAYVQGGPPPFGDIVLHDLSSGEERRMTRDNALISGLAWTADGSTLLFSSNRTGDHGLWAISREGGEPAALLRQLSKLGSISVSAGADQIAVESWNMRTRIIKVGLGTEEEPGIIYQSGMADRAPTRRPGSDAITFISNQAGGDDVWEVDGQQRLRRLTGLSASVLLNGSWSADGRHFAFSAAGPQGIDLQLYDSVTGRVTPLTSDETMAEVSPAWVDGGRTVCYALWSFRRWGIACTGIETGVTDLVADLRASAVQANGDEPALYFTRWDEPGLWRLDRRTGVIAKLLETSPHTPWNWRVRDGRIYTAASLPEGGTKITIIDVDGTPVREHTLPHRIFPNAGLDVGEDGSLYLTVIGSLSIDLLKATLGRLSAMEG